jgi:biopolymer transport protein ExbD
MRTTLIATLLLAFAQMAVAQGASQQAAALVLTIRLSADGVCSFADTSIPCDQLASRLVSMKLAPNGHVHFWVDPAAKYEMVAAILASLQKTGIKVGFVPKQPSQ